MGFPKCKKEKSCYGNPPGATEPQGDAGEMCPRNYGEIQQAWLGMESDSSDALWVLIIPPVHSIPQHPAASHSTPQHPAASHSTPQHPTAPRSTPQHPTASRSTPQHPTASHSIPHYPTAPHSIPQHPTASHTQALGPSAASQPIPRHNSNWKKSSFPARNKHFP